MGDANEKPAKTSGKQKKATLKAMCSVKQHKENREKRPKHLEAK
ncbi:hypothetical protein [Streptosporangium sp. NPDC000396]